MLVFGDEDMCYRRGEDGTGDTAGGRGWMGWLLIRRPGQSKLGNRSWEDGWGAVVYVRALHKKTWAIEAGKSKLGKRLGGGGERRGAS